MLMLYIHNYFGIGDTNKQKNRVTYSFVWSAITMLETLSIKSTKTDWY